MPSAQYTGCCHTDLHALKGDWPAAPSLPLVGGHEGCGRIVAIGDGSITTYKTGDRVGVKWLADSCLNCEVCREGQEGESTGRYLRCTGPALKSNDSVSVTEPELISLSAATCAHAQTSGYSVDGSFQQ